MIAFLASALVVLAIVAIVAVVITCRETMRRVLHEFSEAERLHRLERAAIMRAVVARSGAELGMLDRIDGQAEAARTGSTVKDRSRQLTEDEFKAMLAADMERIRGVGDEFVPATPEGL